MFTNKSPAHTSDISHVSPFRSPYVNVVEWQENKLWFYVCLLREFIAELQDWPDWFALPTLPICKAFQDISPDDSTLSETFFDNS